MEVDTKELGSRQAVLTATIDEEWLDPFMKKASRRLASRVEIPGFRKGKAPHGVVVRHMGREALVREVIDDLGQAAYEEALKQSGLEPIQMDDLEIAEWEPLALRMTVSLPPVVELGEYRSVPVTKEDVVVTGKDVEEALGGFQEQYAERVPVDRPAQLSDFAVLDVEGTVDDRVVLKSEGQEYELAENGDAPVPGFAHELTGMSPGEDRSFSLTYPENYEGEDLAGREVSFRVHLHDLQEKRRPPVDDELAKMAGGHQTLDELREDIRQELHASREAKQQDDLAEGLLDTLLEQAEIDSPPTFVNRELESMVRRLAYDLQEQGFTLDGYLKTTGRTLENLIEEFRPTAEKRVSKSLILAQLVKAEGVQVEDSDIEQEVARMTRVYGQQREALREALLGNEQIKEEIRNRLYGRKVVQRLAVPAGAAEGQEVEVGSVVADPEESSSDMDTSPESAESV